jgi:neurotrimin
LAKHLFSVPPKILTKEDIADLVVREGENLTLSCEASGHPSPHIVWRREDGEDIMVSGKKGNNVFQKLG